MEILFIIINTFMFRKVKLELKISSLDLLANESSLLISAVTADPTSKIYANFLLSIAAKVANKKIGCYLVDL